ncbi:MAG: acyl-CoA dehydrogenase family protein [Euryarchaeota archaeon]|nr:acyl-CoA dehydrogenase family protein [Euryarchaeota archaeon]
MTDFFQDPPRRGNPYLDDPLLAAHLRRVLPAEVQKEVEEDLVRWGDRLVEEVVSYQEDAEANEPSLVQWDPWGRRVDRIVTSNGWRALKRVSAEEGLVALAYERNHGPASRIHQVAKLYLFHPWSAIYNCPLAMTDGAARLIESLAPKELEASFRRLASRDPKGFWTSGQWMTEKTGGSDVQRSLTVAKKEGDDWTLWGKKWFTSATDAEMAFTLAKCDGDDRLSLFYLETAGERGEWNGIRVDRLKDKLGTRALPTAELTLEGAKARLVGERGAGVRNIAILFNVTRIHNAVSSVSSMRHIINLARDYATKRVAFGAPLSEKPLHMETLGQMEATTQACFHLLFRAAELQGKVECGTATADEDKVLRLLTPLIKLYTAKEAVRVVSEGIEAFGGAGYIEDTGLPRILRDTQVLTIWEGTTNVLSLDALRAIHKEGAFGPFYTDLTDRLGRVADEALINDVEQLRQNAAGLHHTFSTLLHEPLEVQERHARTFAIAMAQVYAGALLLEHEAWVRGRGD